MFIVISRSEDYPSSLKWIIRLPKASDLALKKPSAPTVEHTFPPGYDIMNMLQAPNAFFLICLILYFWIRHGFIKRTEKEKKIVSRIDGIEKLLLGLMAFAVLLLPILYLFTPFLSVTDYNLPWSLRWAGSPVLLASLWLFWRSHLDLGQNWSVSIEVREHHELVSNGVYRSIRHPMYASIWLWSIAQGLMLGNWLAGWATLPVFAAMYFIRLPREEGLMVETFGDSYREYSAQTGRIFPRLVKKHDEELPRSQN